MTPYVVYNISWNRFFTLVDIIYNIVYLNRLQSHNLFSKALFNKKNINLYL